MATKPSDFCLLSEDEIRRSSRFPCVQEFVRAFASLSSRQERLEVSSAVRDFLDVYKAAHEEVPEADGEPQVLSESSAETLAETMTLLKVKPGTKGPVQ